MTKQTLSQPKDKSNAVADPWAGMLDSVAERVAMRVLEALESKTPEPEYRDQIREAHRLGTGIATIARMCREGCPHVYVGDQRRFKAADVDAWLAARAAQKRGGE